MCAQRADLVARVRNEATNAITQTFARQSNVAKGPSHGKLQGLSYMVKENICTIEGYTTCASKIFGADTIPKSPACPDTTGSHSLGYRSPFDATVIELLRAEGATCTGKTNMDEFGMGSFTTNSIFGSTVNPISKSKRYTAGGSSGGSAAIVASDPNIDFSLGTDTGGSVRQPASHCGVYGLKPSYGAISRLGIVPYANSLDTVGIFVAKNRLCTLRDVFAVVNHHDDQDPTSPSKYVRARAKKSSQSRKLRIGIPAEYNVTELSDTVRNAWKSAIACLTQHCDVIPVSLPTTKYSLPAYYVLAPAEASSNLARYSGVFYGFRSDIDRYQGILYAKTREEGFGPEVKRRILLGTYTLTSDRMDNYYLQAQRVRRLIVQDFDRVFVRTNPLYQDNADDDESDGKVDALLTPCAMSPALTLEQVENKDLALGDYANDIFTVPSSLAGLPALSVPFARTGKDGLPIGMQLIGQYGDESTLMDIAELMPEEEVDIVVNT